jgi:hypothetical protein
VIRVYAPGVDEIRSYSRDEAPEVEVLWEGQWCYGTLHQWRRGPDCRWLGWVRFHVRAGENRIANFDQDDLRLIPTEA